MNLFQKIYVKKSNFLTLEKIWDIAFIIVTPQLNYILINIKIMFFIENPIFEYL